MLLFEDNDGSDDSDQEAKSEAVGPVNASKVSIPEPKQPREQLESNEGSSTIRASSGNAANGGRPQRRSKSKKCSFYGLSLS